MSVAQSVVAHYAGRLTLHRVPRRTPIPYECGQRPRGDQASSSGNPQSHPVDDMTPTMEEGDQARAKPVLFRTHFVTGKLSFVCRSPNLCLLALAS